MKYKSLRILLLSAFAILFGGGALGALLSAGLESGLSAKVAETDDLWTLETTIDFTTATYAENPTLVLESTKCGTAYDTGNKKQQDIFKATEPAELGGRLAFQAVSNGVSGSKGWWIRASNGGLWSYNAGRSAAVLDLTTGDRVVFNCTQAASVVMSLVNANNEPDGPFTYELSEDGKSYICTMIGDGNIGFFGNQSQGYISSIEIYKPNGEVTLADYTVKYVDGEGKELKEASTYQGIVGTTPVVSEKDKERITVEGVTYIYSSDDAADQSISKDGSTVVTIVFKKPEPISYEVNEVAGGQVVRTTEGKDIQGTSIKVPYRSYNVVDGKLYKRGVTNKEYNHTFTLSTDGQVEKLDYTEAGKENVVFISEGEDIEGLTLCTGSDAANSNIRSSNSAAAYAEEDVEIVTLPAGIYTLHAVIFDASKEPNSYWTFKAGEEEVANLHCTAINYQELASEEFTLTKETAIVMAKAGSNKMGLDLIYIVKTGDVEVETVETIGTYAMTIQPTTIMGETQEKVDIQVEVKKSGEKYWMESDYFKGLTIPFTYNDVTKTATFEQTYVTKTSDEAFAESPYLWSAAFVFDTFTEPQPTYPATFDPETGFVFGETAGLAWFASDDETTFNPINIYAAFFVVPAASEEVIYGDASIEGEWEFAFNDHYAGDWSLGKFTAQYAATLDGNTVTFEDLTDSYNIVAEFTAENTLTFKVAIVGNPEALSPLTQNPYTDGTKVSDIGIDPENFVFQTFTATYDPEAGTITFPEGSGLAFGYANKETGVFSYYNGAFDFVSASKAKEVIYGDASIEGEWKFTINDHYVGASSRGKVEDTYTATLNGNVVTFADEWGDQPIVAEFTAENTLTFKVTAVGPLATNTLHQSPFVAGPEGTVEDINPEDFTFKTFTATYNPENGTIAFPEGSGLVYGYADASGMFSYYTAAFELVSASKAKEVIYGDASIEGEWKFTINDHYVGASSRGKVEDTYTATLNGNVVTFADEWGDQPIVAEFTAENTLTFKVTAVGTPAINTLHQSPFVAGPEGTVEDINPEDFTFKTFTATYNPENGTIAFPEGSGLVYGYADASGMFSYYTAAFELVSASKAPVYNVIGTYTMTIQPTDIDGGKSQSAVDIQVEVRNSGDKYWMIEQSKTNYFNEQVIPFTYNEEIQFAQFTASYVGELGGNPIWFSPFVFNGSNTEPQETYGVTFDTTTGFEFPGNSGFGWFVTPSAEIFDAQELYSAFYVAGSGNEDNYADASIEGEWDFTLNGHYLGAYSLGEFTEKFTATLDGNTVTFASSGSQYNIVAEFTAENTLTFTKGAVNTPATYTLWQSPYVNTAGVEDLEELTEEVFTATYDPEAGTISFSANSGLRYGYFSAEGALSYWDDAFDFVSASKSKGETTAIETIDAKTEKADAVYYDLNGRRVNAPKAGSIYVKKSGNNVQKVVIK